MKAIQITVDDRLIARLDRDKEVRLDGRSAVIRRALVEYLDRGQKKQISLAYRRAYATTQRLPDLDGWADEGTWPSE